MPRPRLLLLEFLTSDPFSQRRSELFPFVQGYAKARGVDVRWLYAAYDPEALPAGPFRMALDGASAAALAETLADFGPTHALLNEQLHESLAAQLCAAAAGLRRRTFGLENDPYALEHVAEWDTWLGLPTAGDDDALLPDAFEPDYACTPLGETARALRPIVPVVGGTTCLYRRPLSRNPHYREVDLDGAVTPTRCAFCAGPPERAANPYRTPPVDLALRQIEAAQRTCPPGRFGKQFFLTAGVHFAQLVPLFERTLAAELPAATFHVSCRIDELLRKAPKIEALLPRLRDAGHALSVAYVGVENFSPTENERLNKGISARQVEEFFATITRWEAAFPENFLFHAHGGFGYILFTPWTDVADLRLNLAAAERFGVPPGSFFFVSRVQLLTDLPVTRLAERDGLVTASFDAEAVDAFDSGCLSSEREVEVCWRFARPAMAAVYELFALVRQRFAGGKAVAATVAARLGALLDRLPEAERSPYRFLPLVLDVAEAHPQLRRAGELLDQVEHRLRDALTTPVVDEAASADANPFEQTEPAAAAEQRAHLEQRLRDMLGRMLAHPARPLRGFIVAEVSCVATGEGWGQLRLGLARGDGRLTFFVRPRETVPHAFAETARFAWMHDGATPVDTPEKRKIADLLARGFERHAG